MKDMMETEPSAQILTNALTTAMEVALTTLSAPTLMEHSTVLVKKVLREMDSINAKILMSVLIQVSTIVM
jgi:uncharacterized protein with PIN domain